LRDSFKFRLSGLRHRSVSPDRRPIAHFQPFGRMNTSDSFGTCPGNWRLSRGEPMQATPQNRLTPFHVTPSARFGSVLNDPFRRTGELD
jgi:hypothetical protein